MLPYDTLPALARPRLDRLLAAAARDDRTVGVTVGGSAVLLAAFSGEHVGEPRLLIALYGPPLLHVDIKVVALRDLADRVEDAHVLWDREAPRGSDGDHDRRMAGARRTVDRRSLLGVAALLRDQDRPR
jgi:hypothetical protein